MIFKPFPKVWAARNCQPGHFVQERELAGFPKPMRTEGVYFLDLKKGIVWETLKPFANTMIFSEKGIKSVNKHGAQVISAQDIPYLKTVNALMLSLFSAQTERLDKDFDILLKGSSAHWTMTLVPKKTSALASVFKTLKITAPPLPRASKWSTVKMKQPVFSCPNRKN